MVQKGHFKKAPATIPMPPDRMKQAEQWLGKHGTEWELVNASSLATRRGDPLWAERECLAGLNTTEYLNALRRAGFLTRAGHAGFFVRESVTKGFVYLHPIRRPKPVIPELPPYTGDW
jgi:hypothetical protein